MLLIQSTPIEVRQLNINDFRLTLRDLEDSEQGMLYVDTHIHNPPVTISGVTLARVVEIINGYTITFEDGAYAVNIVGGNSNVADVVNINNVGVRTANSAGLQDAVSLQASSFLGQVAVDTSSIYDGTTFPVGTRSFPANNMADAEDIATDRGLKRFLILDSVTLTPLTGLDEGHIFAGDSPVIASVYVGAGADVTNGTFEDITVSGGLDGQNVLKRCLVTDVDFGGGFMWETGLSGTVTLTGGSAFIFSCYSAVPGGSTPVIDMGGAAGADLAVRGYSGGLTIINSSAPGEVSFDFESGKLVFDSTVTGGTYYVRGVCEITDNSGPGATVVDQTIDSGIDDISASITSIDGNIATIQGDIALVHPELEQLRKLLRNKTVTDPDTGIMTVYDDDDSTPLFTAAIFEDVVGLQAYRGKGVERRERFV